MYSARCCEGNKDKERTQFLLSRNLLSERKGNLHVMQETETTCYGVLKREVNSVWLQGERGDWESRKVWESRNVS